MANDLRLQVLLQALDKASGPLRTIDAASRNTVKALRATRGTLRELELQQESMTGFRKLKNEAEQTGTALQAAKQRASLLRQEMAASDTPTRQAAAAYDKAQREVTRLTAAHIASLQAVRKGRSELNAAGITAKNFGAAERELKGKIDRTTASMEIQQRAARNLGVQQQRLAQIERQRAQLGGKLMAAVGTAAVAGYGLSRIIGPGNEFEYQLQLIGNTADMTGAQVADLRSKILAASKATGQSAATVQKALGFLVAAGLDADVAARSIRAIGRTSTAAGADIEDVSRAAFTLTDALNIQPEGLQKALDILAQAGKEGNVELRDMARQLPVLGAGFRSLKMGGNEATATLGAALEIARKGAADPDEAANNMRNYLAKVLSPATLKKAQDAFGLDLYKVIQDAQKTGGNPFEASIEAVMKATGGDQKKLGELFQDMQVQNFLKPIMQNWGEYQRIKAKSLAATGVTDRDFVKIMGTAKQQLDNAAHAAGRLGLAFTATLAPAFGRIAAAVTPVLDRMAAFVQTHPKLVGGITSIVTSLVAMRVALLGIRYGWTFVGGSLAQRSIASLRKALAAQAAARLGTAAPAAAGGGLSALTGIGSAISAIGLPVIALGAAIAAAGLLVWKYWGPIKAWFVGIGKGISDVMGPVLADLGPLKPMWDAITGALRAAWTWVTQLFTPFHATSEQLAGATAHGVTFGRVLGYVLGGVVTAVKWVAQAFAAVGTGIGETLGWIVVHAGTVADWFGTAWASLTDAIKAPFTTAFAWITSKIDALMAKWEWIKQKLGLADDAAKARGWDFNDGRTPPPRFDTPPLRAPGGGTTHTTHVGGITVVQQPGEDGAALARRVRAEIEASDRAKAAARGSRLRDPE
ncbi:MAG: phage tail tape measure protein [Rhodanobacter sp.]|nr:phage tail tape measure protein [Rhodanobacter sp.]